MVRTGIAVLSSESFGCITKLLHGSTAFAGVVISVMGDSVLMLL